MGVVALLGSSSVGGHGNRQQLRHADACDRDASLERVATLVVAAKAGAPIELDRIQRRVEMEAREAAHTSRIARTWASQMPSRSLPPRAGFRLAVVAALRATPTRAISAKAGPCDPMAALGP